MDDDDNDEENSRKKLLFKRTVFLDGIADAGESTDEPVDEDEKDNEDDEDSDEVIKDEKPIYGVCLNWKIEFCLKKFKL